MSLIGFSQDDKARELAVKKANNHIYEANTIVGDDFVAAEMEYRKALSQQSDNVAGMYNLGNSYYEKGNLEEALYRHQQTAKLATSKQAKHKAFHNMGNVLMKNKKCKEAVEAYKNALRNNPSDDETRYNFALAKDCAKQQEQENKDDDNNKDDKDNSEDKKDENKENKDDKNKENEDKKEGDDKEEEKKDEGEDKEDEKKPEDKKEDKNNKGDKEKEDNTKPQPKPGQLSPQQIKSLLEAMNNQEQKVQEKMNAKH
ncbi:hypothetical protein MHTCC0001_09340 [Flavobacteriaceae bacterium MHTCC 0001]